MRKDPFQEPKGCGNIGGRGVEAMGRLCNAIETDIEEVPQGAA